MEKEKIVIIGAGQHARVVLYNIEEQNKYEVIGFLDSDDSKIGEFFEGKKILANYQKEDLRKFSKNIEELLNKILDSDVKNLFFIYTSGVGRVRYEKKLIKRLEEKNKICLGIFSCKGFDNYGPFKLIGGINKGKPNEDDTQNLIKFLKNIY